MGTLNTRSTWYERFVRSLNARRSGAQQGINKADNLDSEEVRGGLEPDLLHDRGDRVEVGVCRSMQRSSLAPQDSEIFPKGLAIGTQVQVYRWFMTTNTPFDQGPWAPAECTMPTPDRLVRAAEFDDLFATTVTDLRRESPVQLVLELQADEATAERAAGLASRETQCCSFFVFTLTVTGGSLTLRVDVPSAHVAVLDGFVDRVLAGIEANAS